MSGPASVGEVGLLLDEARTATVAAVTSVLALRFNDKAFEAMFQKIPNFGAGLSSGLAYRLQQVSGRVPLPEYDVAAGATHGRGAEAAARAVPGAPPRPALEAGRQHAQSGLRRRSLIPGDPFGAGAAPRRSRALRAHLLAERSTRFCGLTAASPAGGRRRRRDLPLLTPRSPKLDPLLERVVAEGASDLHLAPGCRPHWRIDGDIQAIADLAPLGRDEVVRAPRARAVSAPEGAVRPGARHRLRLRACPASRASA